MISAPQAMRGLVRAIQPNDEDAKALHWVEGAQRAIVDLHAFSFLTGTVYRVLKQTVSDLADFQIPADVDVKPLYVCLSVGENRIAFTGSSKPLTVNVTQYVNGCRSDGGIGFLPEDHPIVTGAVRDTVYGFLVKCGVGDGLQAPWDE